MVLTFQNCHYRPRHRDCSCETDEKLYASEEKCGSSGDPPIDAVSYDLARRLHRQWHNKVPEKQVQYGQLKDPIDNPRRKCYRNVPEHRLYAIDKTVVELKRPAHRNSHEDSCEDAEPFKLPHVGGYKDFGYKNAVFEEKNFRIKPVYTRNHTPDCDKPKDEDCGCGSPARGTNLLNYIRSSRFLAGFGPISYSS